MKRGRMAGMAAGVVAGPAAGVRRLLRAASAPRVGVAIGVHGVWAVRLPGNGRRGGEDGAPEKPMWQALEAAPREGEWTSLRVALEYLREDLRGAGQLHVALLPPLAELRRVELPPVRAGDVAPVLARGAERYLGPGAEPRALVVRPGRQLPAGANGGAARLVLVSSAPERLVAQVEGAARAAGWRLASIVPAQSAWLRAAHTGGSEGWRGQSRGRRRAGSWRLRWARWGPPAPRRAEKSAPSAVLVAGAGRADLLATGGAVRARLDVDVRIRRLPLGGRSVPAAPALAALLDESGVPAGTIVRVLAPRSLLDGYTEALRGAGYEAAPGAAPEVAAARHAGESSLPALASASAMVRARTRAWRQAGVLAAAGIAFLVLAAATELWGTRRALARVQAERRDLRRQVAVAMAWRDSTDAARAVRNMVERTAAAAPRWSVVIADFAERLPHDSYLAWLHGAGDSVVVEGAGASAGSALRDLEASSVLRRVRLTGPIRRELREGEEAVEHFGVAARLRAGVALPKPARLQHLGMAVQLPPAGKR